MLKQWCAVNEALFPVSNEDSFVPIAAVVTIYSSIEVEVGFIREHEVG